MTAGAAGEASGTLPPPNDAQNKPSTPAGPVSPKQISYAGLVVFILGLIIVAIGFLFLAILEYDVQSSQGTFGPMGITTVDEIVFFGCVGFGILIVAAGWALDQSRVGQAFNFPTVAGRRTRRLAGMTLVLLGMVLIATFPFIGLGTNVGYYLSMPLVLPAWTNWFFFALTFLGFLLLAAGWLAHRTATLPWYSKQSL